LNFNDSNENKEVNKINVFQKLKSPETQKILDSIKAKKNLTEEDSLTIKGLNAISDSAKIDDVREILELNKTIDPEVEYGNYKTRKS
ncbi:hypothetical protein, partial [Chryseobacterium sp. SIMBA_029]